MENEERRAYIEDWRVKDNLIIAMNIMNRTLIKIKRNVRNMELYRISHLYILARKLKKKTKVTIYEASKQIKEMAKNGLLLQKKSI